MKVACIQLTSGADIAANISRIETLVKQAADRGAELIALPENAFLMEEPGAPRILYTHAAHAGLTAAALMARTYRCWLLIGSVALKIDESGKTVNRSLLFNPEGAVAAQYDKIHLFDVELADGEKYAESARFLSGNKVVIAKMDREMWGCGDVGKENFSPSPHISTSPHPTLGLTICYDVRFPHLYRRLAKAGADIIAVPSAFTQTTGEAHWHVLLRARAIENGCFVIAPAQTGTHPGNRKTYGHALIVDPWGRVLADAGTEEGIIVADLDLSLVKQTRARLPSLEHDREFS